MIDLYYWQYSVPKMYGQEMGEEYFSGFYRSGDRADIPDGAEVEAGHFISKSEFEALQSYKRKLIEACEMWCNDRRTEIVYGGLDKDALRLLEFIKQWEPGEK